MNTLRSPSSVGSTFNIPLDFIDDQTSFGNIFGFHPVIWIVTTRSSRAIEDSDSLRVFFNLCSLFHLYIFVIFFSCNALRRQPTIPTK